ncbi:hypothetical protein P7K49_040930, partial [Saguinus oedipus]
MQVMNTSLGFPGDVVSRTLSDLRSQGWRTTTPACNGHRTVCVTGERGKAVCALVGLLNYVYSYALPVLCSQDYRTTFPACTGLRKSAPSLEEE